MTRLSRAPTSRARGPSCWLATSRRCRANATASPAASRRSRRWSPRTRRSTRACARCSPSPEGVEVIGVVADALETGSEHERARRGVPRRPAAGRAGARRRPGAARDPLAAVAERRPRRLPAARLRAHPLRLRAAARDRLRGAEGARVALGLLPRQRTPCRAHPRVAARRDRGCDARGRARASPRARARWPS